jgi:hypothetical protein
MPIKRYGVSIVQGAIPILPVPFDKVRIFPIILQMIPSVWLHVILERCVQAEPKRKAKHIVFKRAFYVLPSDRDSFIEHAIVNNATDKMTATSIDCVFEV